MADRLNKLDADQVIKRAGLSLDGSVPDGGLAVLPVGGTLVPERYDSYDLTYVGATENIQTITYKLNGSTIATLTISYDGSNRITSVVRS